MYTSALNPPRCLYLQLALALLSIVAPYRALDAHAAESLRPNVVLILADDLE